MNRCSSKNVGHPSSETALEKQIRSTWFASRCERRSSAAVSGWCQSQLVALAVRFRALLFARRSFLFWLSVFVALGPAQTVFAVEEAQTRSDEELLAEEYVGLLKEKLELKAKLNFLREEEKILNSLGSATRGVGETLDQTKNLDEKFRTAFKDILEGRLKGVKEHLDEIPPTASAESLPKDFVDIRRELAAGRTKLIRARAQKDFAGQLASLLNVQNRWLWLGGLLAAMTWVGLFVHERRHELRRLRWVRRGRASIVVALLTTAILFLLLPTVSMFALGNRTYDALVALAAQDGANELGIAPETERDTLNDEVKNLQEDVRKQVAQQSKSLPAVQQRLDQAFAQGTDKANLSENWTFIRQKLLSIYVEHVSSQEIASKLSDAATKLEDIQRLLDKEQGAIANFEKRNRLFALALGLVFLAATATAGAWLIKKQKAKVRNDSKTCPRCLSVGKLIRESTPGNDSLGLVELRCSNIVNESFGTPCDFTFHEQHSFQPKLSFPTLGVGSAGKTHWLAMVYRELNQGRHPDNVHFERVRSRGSEDFDLLLQRILNSRLSTSATGAQDLPDPVVFSFRDNDQWGKSSILLNVFDFAGQITANADVRDFMRQRQLRSDGYFFFLDPLYESETQAEALIKFREEVKLIKKLGPGNQLHCPVALCLTKIDLLVTKDYAGGDAIKAFYSDLDKIDKSGEPGSLELIRQRSQLVAGLRDTIWPNWEIERQIRDLFGERFMFFPMTPVGLDDVSQMTDPNDLFDLTKRTIKPYGIIEPLLWLMQMNGYPVLKE